VDFDLIFKIVFHIFNQEAVGRVYQLLVIRVIYCIPVHPILYEENSQLFHSKVAKEPLVFTINSNLLASLKKQKVFSTDALVVVQHLIMQLLLFRFFIIFLLVCG